MKKIAFLLILMLAASGYGQQTPSNNSAHAAKTPAATPVEGPFTSREMKQFAALDPIDAHTHVYWASADFYAMLKKLHLRILDIMLDDDHFPGMNLGQETDIVWKVTYGSDGHVAVCTTFDPYRFSQEDFAQESIRKINDDFAKGAVAVKLWKNVGMEIQDAKGNYLMPDNPIFAPIYKDIAAHDKTLITHVADPDDLWEAPNPRSPNYKYIMNNPEWYMYRIPSAPSKASILLARDHILDRNPHLRMVGAHLGSMESNFDELARHLDRYPNFAVDLAARISYLEMQPRAKMIAFITKYQDRLIYGTDNDFMQASPEDVHYWESAYVKEWRYLATDDTIPFGHGTIEGLNLPQSILRKIYHDNAVRWFPGILKTPVPSSEK